MSTTRNEERVYIRGKTVTIDLRCYGLERMVCRDPKSSGWPKRGRKAESVEEGEGWRAAYRAYSLTGRTAREVMTLADAIREYIREHREGGTRRNTIKCDSVALNLLLKVYDGGERDLVSELEPARLQKEFRQRLRTGQAPATLAGYKISLKKFGRWIGGKKFGKKLVKGLKVGKVEARRKGRAWTPQELRKLRDAADRIDQDPKRRQKVDRWYRMVLELGLATGARVGELFAIRWENFSPDVQLVHIEEQLQPITKDAAEPLKSSSAVRTTTVLETWAPFHRRGIEGRVLEGTSGRARSVAFTLIKREAKLDLPGVGYHSLRHTWAKVLLQERGATLLQLSAACGHSHYATTEKYYLHLCRDQMTESLRALAAPQPSPGAPWTAPNTVVGTGVGTDETNYSQFLDA